MEHICDVRQEKQHSTETKTSDGELQLDHLHKEAYPKFHYQQNVVCICSMALSTQKGHYLLVSNPCTLADKEKERDSY